MTMDVEAEIRDLKRRVGELEGSFGFLTEQVKGVHRDLLRFEEKTDKKLQEHDGRSIGSNRTSKACAPTCRKSSIADSMREVLREQKGKS